MSTRLVEELEAFRTSGDAKRLSELIPYVQFMGFRLEIRDDRVLGTMPFAPRLIGNPGLPALHGGTVGSLLEFVSIFHVLWEGETLLIPKTVNLTVEYLRSGKALDTFCEGSITKQGRRIVNVRAEAWQLDRNKPIAASSAHFLLVPASEAVG